MPGTTGRLPRYTIFSPLPIPAEAATEPEVARLQKEEEEKEEAERGAFTFLVLYPELHAVLLEVLHGVSQHVCRQLLAVHLGQDRYPIDILGRLLQHEQNQFKVR